MVISSGDDDVDNGGFDGASDEEREEEVRMRVVFDVFPFDVDVFVEHTYNLCRTRAAAARALSFWRQTADLQGLQPANARVQRVRQGLLLQQGARMWFRISKNSPKILNQNAYSLHLLWSHASLQDCIEIEGCVCDKYSHPPLPWWHQNHMLVNASWRQLLRT